VFLVLIAGALFAGAQTATAQTDLTANPD